jgi:PTH1 family peptidyl-tRNA hydrolase
MFPRKPRDLPQLLAIGLGNPGARYAGTRHNAGWWVLDELQRRHGGGKGYTKHRSAAVPIQMARGAVLLVRPQTFMNVSGEAVAAWLKEFQEVPWVLIHDETAFEPGQVRMRRTGSAGGHNGVQSVIDRLHTREFDRIRVGVGSPHSGAVLSDYVLQSPNATDLSLINQAVSRAADCVELLVQGEFDKAAQLAVGKEPRQGPPKPEGQSGSGGKAEL